MSFKPSRLRAGEILAGAGGLTLLVFLFGLGWLSKGSGHTSTGWSGLPVLRWLIIVCGFTALALAVAQGTRSAPAIPVTLSVFVSVLGAATTLGLIVRMLTTGDSLEVGAWLGLLSAIAIAAGGFLSLRKEGGWNPAPDRPVRTVSLGSGPTPPRT